MQTQIQPVTFSRIQPIILMVLNSVSSAHTKRAYERGLTDFVAWFQATNQTGLNKATVNAYVSDLRAAGTSASSINGRLVAIRKLANEAADNGLIDHAIAQAIGRAQGVRIEGKRLGNWLTVGQAQALIRLPDVKTSKGLRDRAILAVLLGCGLRREECASLTVGHIQQRDGRWVIVDLAGKRNKLRSVPVPSWAKAAVDAWCQSASVADGALFRSFRRGGHVQPDAMSAAAIFDVVKHYAAQIGVEARPHDLRRTFAKLADKAGAPLAQIQKSLGHDSVQTTERYIGSDQDFTNAPCDVLGLHL